MDKVMVPLLLVGGGFLVWYLTKQNRPIASTPTQVIISQPAPLTNSGGDGMFDFLTSLSGNVAGVATSYIENVSRYEVSPEQATKDAANDLMPN